MFKLAIGFTVILQMKHDHVVHSKGDLRLRNKNMVGLA